METDLKPLIGMPMYPIREEGEDSTTSMGGLRSYADRLTEAGAAPVFLPLSAISLLDVYLAQLRGVLLPGGGDVDPAYFGEEPHPELGLVQPERDEFEIALCRAALEKNLPILGICRGAQVLNVAMGGSLIQDIPSQCVSTINHRSPDETELRHEIEVQDDTLLADIIGGGRHPVNSQHHQAVLEPAAGLIVSAGSPEDGIIEAVEARNGHFVLGVQFHPECLPDRFSSLFSAFVSVCARRS